MKTRLVKLSGVLFLYMVTLACGNGNSPKNVENNNDCKNELKELYSYLDTPFNYDESVPETFDFCGTKEALLTQREYNTITGIAEFSIPIPKGSNLKFLKKEDDTLYYDCDFHDTASYGDQDLIIENKTFINLPRVEGKDIWVAVRFHNFKDNTCKNIDILGEKKKLSQVEGHPLAPGKEDKE